MPEKPDGDKSKGPGLTRLERMRKDAKDQEFSPPMPPCGVGGYLIDYLYEIGPSLGEHALSHVEIEAWQRNTGIALDVWQCRTLHMLSRVYLGESHLATKRDRPAPWSAQSSTPAVLSVTARSLEESMRDLADL